MAKSYNMELTCLSGKMVKLNRADFEVPIGAVYGLLMTSGASLERLYKDARVYMLNKKGEAIDTFHFQYLNKRHQAIAMVAIQDELERLQAIKKETGVESGDAPLFADISGQVGYNLTYDLGSSSHAFVASTVGSTSATLTQEHFDAVRQRMEEQSRIMARDMTDQMLYGTNPLMALAESSQAFGGAEIQVPLQAPSRRTARVSDERSARSFEPDGNYVRNHFTPPDRAGERTYNGNVFYIGEWRAVSGSTWSPNEYISLMNLIDDRDARLGRDVPMSTRPVAAPPPVRPTVGYVRSNVSYVCTETGSVYWIYTGDSFAIGLQTVTHGTVFTPQALEDLYRDLVMPELNGEIPF